MTGAALTAKNGKRTKIAATTAADTDKSQGLLKSSSTTKLPPLPTQVGQQAQNRIHKNSKRYRTHK